MNSFIVVNLLMSTLGGLFFTAVFAANVHAYDRWHQKNWRVPLFALLAPVFLFFTFMFFSEKVNEQVREQALMLQRDQILRVNDCFLLDDGSYQYRCGDQGLICALRGYELECNVRL
jgi:hypothetical protein